MDKQDAIDFIVEEFERGASPSEIARSLSTKLNAPQAVVESFVSRTLEGRMALMESPEPAYTIPAAFAVDTPDCPEEPAPAAFAPVWQAPAAPAAIDEPLPLPAPPVPASPAGATAAPATGRAVNAIDPKLEKFILDLLGSDKKHSDVVMLVCERAGVDWSEAQRLVGRVNAYHHKKISARRNRVLIPFAIVTLLVGLGLVLACLSELSAYRATLDGLNTAGLEGAVGALPQSGSVSDLRYLIAQGALGLGLLMGGGIGLFQALKTQME